MIGYYVHHHGRGHLGRARAIADALGERVTGLSSLRRPDAWPGEWIELPLDVPDAGPDAASETTAQGRLHWAPVGVEGLRDRMAAISAWIAAARPSVVVADVSVEVALLARLHGARVITVALPGVRDDAAHALGFEVSTAIIAAWPRDATGMLSGLSAHAAARLHPVGAISRFPPAGETPPDAAASARPRRALVLAGGGGDGFTAERIAAARAGTPGWELTHIGGSSGLWIEDPRAALRSADVVVTHAGQTALADVAAALRPAIVVPQRRPYGEQAASGRVLAAGPWPAIVVARMPEGGWGRLLAAAAALDGGGWRSWNDGAGATRAARVIADVAAGAPTAPEPGSRPT